MATYYTQKRVFTQTAKTVLADPKLFKNEGQKEIMIGRCFGHLSKELNLREADELLKKARGKEFSVDVDKRYIKKFTIKSLEKGRLRALTDREFISCLLKVELVVNKLLPAIDEEKDEIVQKTQQDTFALSIPAWIFKDEIIFSKAEMAREIAVPYLKRILGIDITIPAYNIGKIYEDYKSEAGKIFGFGFIDRPNSIGKGAIFGEMDVDDPLVAELDESDKNFVAVNLKVGNQIVRASIYSIGSIVIMQSWLKMAENYTKLKAIRKVLEKYEV